MDFSIPKEILRFKKKKCSSKKKCSFKNPFWNLYFLNMNFRMSPPPPPLFSEKILNGGRKSIRWDCKPVHFQSFTLKAGLPLRTNGVLSFPPQRLQNQHAEAWDGVSRPGVHRAFVVTPPALWKKIPWRSPCSAGRRWGPGRWSCPAGAGGGWSCPSSWCAWRRDVALVKLHEGRQSMMTGTRPQPGGPAGNASASWLVRWGDDPRAAPDSGRRRDLGML